MTGISNWRAWLAFAHDVGAAALAWASIYWLRVSLDAELPYRSEMLRTLAIILPLQATIFLIFGLYRGLWRFASLVDLKRIVLSSCLGAGWSGSTLPATPAASPRKSSTWLPSDASSTDW